MKREEMTSSTLFDLLMHLKLTTKRMMIYQNDVHLKQIQAHLGNKLKNQYFSIAKFSFLKR